MAKWAVLFWKERWKQQVFQNPKAWKMGSFKVILSFPVTQNPTISGIWSVSSVPRISDTWKCAANSMTGMSPSRWHFGKCCYCSEGQKHAFLLSQLQKEWETETERHGVRWQGRQQEETLTPRYWDSYHLALATLSPDTNVWRQMSPPATGWILPPREAQVPAEKAAEVFTRSKMIFIFQDSVNKITFQFFNRKHFSSKETLKFQLQTLVTPFATWSYHLPSRWQVLN